MKETLTPPNQDDFDIRFQEITDRLADLDVIGELTVMEMLATDLTPEAQPLAGKVSKYATRRTTKGADGFNMPDFDPDTD